jgi:hypothetical protein
MSELDLRFVERRERRQTRPSVAVSISTLELSWAAGIIKF